jgi:hypothetical protein
MQIVLDVADEFKPVLDELPLLLRVVSAKVEEIRASTRCSTSTTSPR